MSVTIAFWCVFIAGLLPVGIVFIAKADPRLDVHNPRDVHLTQTGLRKRAYGAHLNGNEAFPLFAAGVIIASLRDVPQPLLDGVAIVWIAIRLVYTGVYLADVAKVRPALWLLGVIVAASLFVLPS